MSRAEHAFLFELRVKARIDRPCVIIRAYDRPQSPGDKSTGHNPIDIEVTQAGKTIFARGQLYCAVNRWTTTDGIAARELVLSTVAMKPGDTDADYFADYSPEQLNWAREHGEYLDMVRLDRYCDPETGDCRA